MIHSPFETVLLGRIGSELAAIYHDTLHAPLPPGMQELIERLERDSLAPITTRNTDD